MILTEHKDTKTQSFSWHCDQLNSLCLCVFVFKISAEHLSVPLISRTDPVIPTGTLGC